jgi:translation elongation factor EF-4
MVEDVSLRHNIEWKEVCAKTGEGVKELFEEIVLRVLKRKEKIKEDVELMLK